MVIKRTIHAGKRLSSPSEMMKNIIPSTGHFFDNAFAPNRTSKQATHGADKKEESFPSLSLLPYFVPFSITSRIRWGRWRYVEDRRRGGQARWVVSEQGTAGWKAVVREGAHRRVGQERV